MTRHLWIAVVIILLIPVVVVTASHSGDAGFSSVNGDLVSGIPALDSLLLMSSGKPVVLNFWATWCGPCVRELPELDALAGELGDSAVFIAVDIGDPDLSTVTAFRENNPVGITVVWLDPSDASAVSDRYDLGDVLPVSLVLDRGGQEIDRAVGARSSQWFLSAVTGVAPDTTSAVEEHDVHVYVVGPSGDPLVAELSAAAVQIAGNSGYDVLDPNIPEDSLAMIEAYLPMSGWPYAQLCVSGACRPPVRSSEDLFSAFESMQ